MKKNCEKSMFPQSFFQVFFFRFTQGFWLRVIPLFFKLDKINLINFQEEFERSSGHQSYRCPWWFCRKLKYNLIAKSEWSSYREDNSGACSVENIENIVNSRHGGQAVSLSVHALTESCALTIRSLALTSWPMRIVYDTQSHYLLLHYSFFLFSIRAL